VGKEINFLAFSSIHFQVLTAPPPQLVLHSVESPGVLLLQLLLVGPLQYGAYQFLPFQALRVNFLKNSSLEVCGARS
jgi:hypothetical protein